MQRWLSDESVLALEKEVPVHLRQGLLNYIELGLRPGKFLECVLTNNLRGAVLRHNGGSVEDIRNVVRWICTHAPDTCHGSEKKFLEWLEYQMGRAAADTVDMLR